MSLSAGDRSWISNEHGWIFWGLLVAIIGVAVAVKQDLQVDLLRELCRAHYPECIVETTP